MRAVLESHHFRRRRYYNCCFWHFNSTSARVRSSASQPHMRIVLSGGGRPSRIIRIIFGPYEHNVARLLCRLTYDTRRVSFTAGRVFFVLFIR